MFLYSKNGVSHPKGSEASTKSLDYPIQDHFWVNS